VQDFLHGQASRSAVVPETYLCNQGPFEMTILNWTTQTLGEVLAIGLAESAGLPFRVHSAVWPWSGSCRCCGSQ
jgi:hypothetical protein